MATINGTAIAELLNGTPDNDTIDGGLGNDTMVGGLGNDTYFVNVATDVITELVNQGVDTVNSAVTYTLGAHVDNLTLTGAGNLNGTGNALNNVITGTAGVNTLTGGSGNDTLTGGLGNDVLIGDASGVAGGDALTATAAAYLNSAGNSLIRTLGDVTSNPTPTRAVATGFGENVLHTNDDGSSAAIDITGVFGAGGLDFFGNPYTSLYVNNNGNITFGAPRSSYTPTAIDGGVGNPIIAPFWADVDTRGIPASTTPGGTSGGSNRVYYDLDAVNGVFTVTWDDVGYFGSHTDKQNAFQLQLVDRGSGDFDMIFRYEAVNWTTGDASSGVGGLGGTVARAGYSAGTGSASYFELAQSGNQAAILSLDTTSGNSGRTGVYIFNVRNGNVGAIGDDVLNGGAGADTMRGGGGNDTYVVDNAGDVVTELANAGVDTVQAGLTHVLEANVENLTLTGTGNINGVGNGLANVLTGNSGGNTLTGGAGNDKLDGGAGNDVFLSSPGASGNDSIVGGLGEDHFRENTGNDTLVGGAGDDLFEVGYSGGAVVTATGGAGRDTWALAPGQTNYTYRVTDFDGGPGGDYLDVSDVLDASAQAGFYTGGNPFTEGYLKLVQAGPNVLVRWDFDGAARSGYALVTGLTLLNTTVASVTAANYLGLVIGGASAESIAGGSDDDIILGLAGNDTLTGGGGDDLLFGGVGADTMTGGIGDDTYHVENAGDRVVETSNAPGGLLLPGVDFSGPFGPGLVGIAGITDTVIAAINYSLANLGFVENLTLTGAASQATGNALANELTGNAGNDTLTGGAGNDTLDGGIGNDSMAGGAGNDTYVVNVATDVVTEGLNAGNDTVRSEVSYTLGANVENLTLIGAAAINGTGNTLANVLTGNGAANVLNGGAGNDTMAGGAGNDTYMRNVPGDVVTEAANAGTDVVLSLVTYTLGANVENLTLTGAGAINGTGNALDNVLAGNAANNVLNGGAGGDTASYADAAAGVTVNLGVAAAQNTVGAGTDTLIAIENLTGSDFNDTLTGNDAANVLDGGAGSDTMAGGLGNDTYVRNVTGDVVTEAASAGTDTVRSAVSYTLGPNVENLVLTGAGAINGTGNTLANAITGNTAANILAGDLGNDTLRGGLGNDTLTGGAGQDVFRFDAAPGASNIDRITDFLVADDTIQLENAVFASLGAGPVAATQFRSGAGITTAGDANDFLIYNTTTGALYYDGDGNGAGLAKQIAILTGAPGLTAADFLVI